MKLILAILAFLSTGVIDCTRVRQEAMSSPDVATAVFVIEVDPARVRAVGWAAADASDSAVLEVAERVVRRRLSAMERSLQVRRDASKGLRLEAEVSVQPTERGLVREMLESLGLCEFFFVPEHSKLADLGIDLAAEGRKLEAWREEHPGRPLEEFHQTDVHRRLQWLETRFGGPNGELVIGAPLLVLLPDRPEDSIGAASIARVFLADDSFGYPAIGVEVTKRRRGDFERWTGALVKQRMAIALEGRIRSVPTLQTKLVDRMVIEGRFEEAEVAVLSESLKKHEGPLKVIEMRW